MLDKQHQKQYKNSSGTPTSSGSACVSVYERICLILCHCNTKWHQSQVQKSLKYTGNKCFWYRNKLKNLKQNLNRIAFQKQIKPVLLPAAADDRFFFKQLLCWKSAKCLTQNSLQVSHQLISSAPMWNRMSIEVMPKVTSSISRVQGSETRVTRCRVGTETLYWICTSKRKLGRGLNV